MVEDIRPWSVFSRCAVKSVLMVGPMVVAKVFDEAKKRHRWFEDSLGWCIESAFLVTCSVLFFRAL